MGLSISVPDGPFTITKGSMSSHGSCQGDTTDANYQFSSKDGMWLFLMEESPSMMYNPIRQVQVSILGYDLLILFGVVILSSTFMALSVFRSKRL
jgi:hypothetical protein